MTAVGIAAHGEISIAVDPKHAIILCITGHREYGSTCNGQHSIFCDLSVVHGNLCIVSGQCQISDTSRRTTVGNAEPTACMDLRAGICTIYTFAVQADVHSVRQRDGISRKGHIVFQIIISCRSRKRICHRPLLPLNLLVGVMSVIRRSTTKTVGVIVLCTEIHFDFSYAPLSIHSS